MAQRVKEPMENLGGSALIIPWTMGSKIFQSASFLGSFCTNNCSMGIPIYKANSVAGGECINCLKCVDICPRNNTEANICGESINPALGSSVAIAAMTAVYGLSSAATANLSEKGIASLDNKTSIRKSDNIKVDNANSSIGNINFDDSAKSNSDNSITQETNSKKYKYGTYVGTGTGFRDDITKVQVTIKNGKIAKVETISSEDTSRFYEDTKGIITSEILSTQSTEVDTVSGTTFRRKGIIYAVQKALSKAHM